MTHRKIGNEKVLIVGGGSGMGLALAKRCLDIGSNVVIVGRNEDKLQRARLELGKPASLDTIAVDIAQEVEVADLFRRIGQLDHIVSTAADIEGAYELLPALKLEAAQRVVESKLYGPLLLAKHGSPKLSAEGSITFVSGIAAYRPAARGSVVAAVNAALEGLVRALAIELAPIRVNAVSPGWVNTSIWSFVAGDRKDDMLSAMARRLPVGRVGAGRYRRRHRLSDGQHIHDGDDTACRGRASAGLTDSKASLAAASNSFRADG